MTELQRRIIRLYERRFGKSVLPYVIREKGCGIYRIVDRETGSWIDVEHTGARIRRIAELDNA